MQPKSFVLEQLKSRFLRFSIYYTPYNFWNTKWVSIRLFYSTYECLIWQIKKSRFTIKSESRLKWRQKSLKFRKNKKLKLSSQKPRFSAFPSTYPFVCVAEPKKHLLLPSKTKEYVKITKTWTFRFQRNLLTKLPHHTKIS